jgi:hypothetical protein
MQNGIEVVLDQTADGQTVSTSQIQHALNEILGSVHFRGSSQSQQLLRYIVSQSLEGNTEHLKERIIGAEVFGRSADYDTNIDPIVRSRVAEVRKRLAQYYVDEGKDNVVWIKLKPGSYLATFLDISKPTHEEIRVHQNMLELPQRPPEGMPGPESERSQSSATAKRRISQVQLRIIEIASVLTIVVALGYSLWPKDPVRQFWSPFLKSSKPILIYTGTNPVYTPSNQLITRLEAAHQVSKLDTKGFEFLTPPQGDMKNGEREGDLVDVENKFVMVGDLAANVRVTSLLTRFNHAFDLRAGADVAFGDLRDSPTVLIGAFGNEWTLAMTRDLPFVFGGERTKRSIREVGKGRTWSPIISSESAVQLDYALVARLPHSQTGGALITIAGLTQSGTRAAAEFVTSREEMSDLIKSLPDGWMNRNLEFLLQTKVESDIPTTVSVVAIRTW